MSHCIGERLYSLYFATFRARYGIAVVWLDYLPDFLVGVSGTAAHVGAIQEAIDKLERPGLIGPAAASLLAETFDVPHDASLELA
ncbi:hypothetical protein [Methylorubrum extorquens]|uniref:Uncharacterized protein n=1 Tax=Methylorubrum extorquens TaxID=408 RepID=A0AAX3WIX0_METEX|nr:hypothetical protein [Methylorubrum extorquens]KQO93490.1 hypothetical protein ASF33_16090 [Methylobacterium sp. Leaf92]WHQ70555.1 hypothetical protein KEC54_02730 [Methylorubrum extorquens]